MLIINDVKSGWNIGIYSYKFVLKNSKLLIYPLLSGICFALAAWLLFHVFNSMYGKTGFEIYSNNGNLTPQGYILLGISIISYFIAIFFSIFFNVATVFTVNNYLSGNNDNSIINGIKFSIKKIPAIFAWTLIAGTVGIFLKIIDYIEEKRKTHILSNIMGIAWAVATYFVVPVICFKTDVNPYLLIKDSISTMKEAWNGNGQFSRIMGSQLVTLVLFLFVYFLFQGLSSMAGSTNQGIELYNFTNGFTFTGIAFIFLIGVLIALSNVTNTTLKTIYYRYLTEGFVPKDISANLLEAAIKKTSV